MKQEHKAMRTINQILSNKHEYAVYTPWDAIDDLIRDPNADISYWEKCPDQKIHVWMSDGKEYDMRVVAEEDSIRKYGHPEYWFAFDNNEYIDYGTERELATEFDFTKHILLWKFI